MISLEKLLTPVSVFGIIEKQLLRLPMEINDWKISYGTDGAHVPEFVVNGSAFAGGLCIRMDHLHNDLTVLDNKVAFAIGETIRRREHQNDKNEEKDELPF